MANGKVGDQDLNKMLNNIENIVVDTIKVIHNKSLPNNNPLNNKKFKKNFLDAAAKR